MKKRWFLLASAVLSAVVALLVCLAWGTGQSVAAAVGVAPEPPDEVPIDVLALSQPNAAAGWVIECVDCPIPPHKFADMTDRNLKLDANGYPHLAYGESYLYYAWYDGVSWHHETVDDSPDVGTYASLVLDAEGYAHISYYADADDNLKYAYQDASGWHTQIVDRDVQNNVGVIDVSLALDVDGYPHISYSHSYGYFTSDLRYAYLDSSGWHTETVDSGNVGKNNSLALDGAGHVHIVYEDDTTDYGDTDTSLRYAYLDGSSWDIQTIDSQGGWTSIARYNSLALEPTAPYTPHVSYKGYSDDFKYAYLAGSSWQTQALGFEGAYPSLVLDENGYPYFSYSHNGLQYAYLDGSGWHTQTVTSEDDAWYTSLVFDAAGYMHMGYYDNTGKELKYTHSDALGWHFYTVDQEAEGGNWVGEYTSLALDKDGYVHISYYDDTDRDLKYAYQDVSGWHLQTVDSSGYVGQYTSLALDGDGYPHISYYDDTGDNLKYAYQDASGWYSQTVDSDGRVGQYTSLALEPTAPYTPHISYYDATNEHPKYAYLDGTTWHSQTVGIFAPAGTYTSLALGSDGYPHISYYCHYFSDLRYTHQVTPSGWTNSVVAYYSENWNKVGRFNSLALTDSGSPFISYYDEFLGALRVASPPGWMSTVESVPVWDTSLVMSGTSHHISYYDALHSSLKYAYRQDSTWYSQTIDWGGDVGRYTSLALDGDGYPHISYYDAGRHGLKHAYFSTRPVADFTASPTTGIQPLTVAFTGTATGGEVEDWLWSFGDGMTGTLQNPEHSYTAAGTYTVTLSVTGPGGSDTISRTSYITVYEAVVADFYAVPVSGTLPLAVIFTDTSSGLVAAWQWDFGDGEGSALRNPAHTYSAAGVYTVSLTAQVAGASASLPGGSDTRVRTHYITVTEAPPQVDFSGAPRSGIAPLPVTFTSTVTGTVTDYQWDFGDGGIANTPNPTHTYRSAGSFGVRLAVTGPGGPAEVSKPDYVVVSAPAGSPTATFSADVVSGTVPLLVTFTAVPSGTVEHWLWTFGDGGSAITGPVVSHTYVTSGTFDVRLTVSNTHGSTMASKPGYITAMTKGEEDDYNIYLPLILRGE